MNNFKLHIISFNIPYPPNYGGIIDVYYKLTELSKNNIKIILHCFEYGREKQKILEEICHKVYYYKRKKSIIKLFSFLPFIVATRIDPNLINNILSDKAPVLFEGIHTTGILKILKKNNIRTYIRCHNVESIYYKGLAKFEQNILKKIFFISEWIKISLYQKKILREADALFAISQIDLEFYKKFNPNSYLLPPFHSFSNISSKTGKGDYALFHGNLSVSENKYIAIWLINNIFSRVTIPFVIAGNDIPRNIISLAKKYNHIKIITTQENKTEILEKIIENAHVNILPSFISTGTKLKLLTALYKSRFCITNNTSISIPEFSSLCEICNNNNEYILKLKELFAKQFTSEMINYRKQILETIFSPSTNSQKLINLIFINNVGK